MPHSLIETPHGVDFFSQCTVFYKHCLGITEDQCGATWHTDALHSTFRLNLGTFLSHTHEHGVHRKCCMCASNKPVQGTRYKATEQLSAQEGILGNVLTVTPHSPFAFGPNE